MGAIEPIPDIRYGALAWAIAVFTGIALCTEVTPQ